MDAWHYTITLQLVCPATQELTYPPSARMRPRSDEAPVAGDYPESDPEDARDPLGFQPWPPTGCSSPVTPVP